MKLISIYGFLILMVLGCIEVKGQMIESNNQSDVVLSHAELQNLLETIIKARRARLMRARYYNAQRYAYQNPPVQNPPLQDNSKELAEMKTLLRTLDTRMQTSNSAAERQELEEMRASILRDLNGLENRPNVVIHNTIKTDSSRVVYASKDNSDIEAELNRIRKELAKDRKPRRSKTINKDYTYKDSDEEYSELKKRIRELEREQSKPVPIPAPQVIVKEVPREVKTQDDRNYNDLLDKYQDLVNQINNRPVPETKIIYKESPPKIIYKESAPQIIYKESAPKIIYQESAPRLEEKVWFNNRRVIYFDNASHALRSESNTLLDEIARLMSDHASLKLVIKGFASKKGSPEYNLLLSERRAESIKSGLMRRGIDVSRITSDFHGIDYRPANEQEARRAEIIFLAN